jgi:hypothetical protein
LNNHVQTVADGFNLFAWAATGGPQEYLEETLPTLDFYGFKVLQLK